ncbi:MAG: hypothetical protein OCC49_19570 [Fibrobacterales bacterium]
MQNVNLLLLLMLLSIGVTAQEFISLIPINAVDTIIFNLDTEKPDPAEFGFTIDWKQFSSDVTLATNRGSLTQKYITPNSSDTVRLSVTADIIEYPNSRVDTITITATNNDIVLAQVQLYLQINRSLFYADRATITMYSDAMINPGFLRNTHCQTNSHQPPTQDIWFHFKNNSDSTANGYSRFDGSTWYKYYLPFSDYKCPFEQKNGSLWFKDPYDHNSLIRFAPEKSENDYQVFSSESHPELVIPTNLKLSMLVDGGGDSLWYSYYNTTDTCAAISLFDGVTWSSFNLHKSGISASEVTLNKNNAGELTALLNGTVYKFNGTIFEKVAHENRLSALYSKNTIKTGDYGILKFNGITWDTIYNRSINEVLMTNNDGNYFRAKDSIFLYTGTDLQFITQIPTMPDGTLMVHRTQSGEYWVFNRGQRILKRFDGQFWSTHTETIEEMVGTINWLYDFDDGNIWIDYTGQLKFANTDYESGVSMFNGSTWTHHLETKEVLAITQTSDQTLWFTCRHGKRGKYFIKAFEGTSFNKDRETMNFTFNPREIVEYTNGMLRIFSDSTYRTAHINPGAGAPWGFTTIDKTIPFEGKTISRTFQLDDSAVWYTFEGSTDIARVEHYWGPYEEPPESSPTDSVNKHPTPLRVMESESSLTFTAINRTIRISNITIPYKIQLFTLDGQLLYHHQLKAQKSHQTIQIPGTVTPGLYVVTMHSPVEKRSALLNINK